MVIGLTLVFVKSPQRWGGEISLMARLRPRWREMLLESAFLSWKIELFRAGDSHCRAVSDRDFYVTKGKVNKIAGFRS